MRKYILLMLAVALAAPAFAANPLAPSGKRKNNEPVEITSDALEVLQQENKAIFTGHVVAVQGDVHLKAEKMVVYYASADEKSATEKSAVKKIDVTGGVFLSTPQETASGDYGIYDVANHKIFLNDKVVLTRGQNVLKGDRLVYDFETGKSTFNAPESAPSGKPRQRVNVLFVPGGEEKLPTKQ